MIALLLEAALANRMLSGSHYNEAERLLTAARALASGNSAELEVLAIVGLGDLYRSGAKKNPDFHPDLGRDGKLTEARRLEAQAQQALSTVSDSSLVRGKAFCEFGLLDIEEDQADQALEDYSTALVVVEKLLATRPNDTAVQSQLCRVYTLTGEAHDKLGNVDEAYTYQELAFQGYERSGHKRGMALGQQGMALALEKKGDTAAAVVCWQEVKKIATTGPEVDTYMLTKAEQALARLQG